MPRRNNNNRRRASGSRRKGRVMQRAIPETSIQSSVYTGPIDTIAFKTACDTHTFVLKLTGTLASSAGGVLNTVFDAYSQVSTTSGWTSLTSLFTEFRILAMKVHALPVNKYQTAATQFPIITTVDRINSTPLSSLTDAASYSSAMEHVTGSTINRVVRMDGLDEGAFATTSAGPTSTSRFFVKFYGSGLANSTTYYQYLNTFVVQFRGMQG